VPTEDFFYMTQEMGITEGELAGVDLNKLCHAVAVAEEVIGHPTWGHVSKSGPRPRGDSLYAMDMPFIETLEQAQHFGKGPSVYQGCMSPWTEPIKSAQRDYAEWTYGRFKPGSEK
jgi:hydroxymethylglutaryl-CoA lyase